LSVDRWIEALQMLASGAEEWSDEAKESFAEIRRNILNDFTHGVAERIRGHVEERFPQQHVSGDTAADLVDPYFPHGRPR
jgi:hypothetical protein